MICRQTSVLGIVEGSSKFGVWYHFLDFWHLTILLYFHICYQQGTQHVQGLKLWRWVIVIVGLL